MATQAIDLYVAFGQRRLQDPLHWMLLAAPQGGDRCIYYHVTGGPTQGAPYQLQIQANKRLNSSGISSKEYISTIDPRDINKVTSSAQRPPLRRCQLWTVDVLQDLERKGLAPAGVAGRYAARVEPTPY